MFVCLFLLAFLFCFLNFTLFPFFHCALFVMQTGFSHHMGKAALRSSLGGRVGVGSGGEMQHCSDCISEGPRLQEFQELESLSMYCVSYKSMKCILNDCPTCTHFITCFNVHCKVPAFMLKR